jgi:hypothetical protein
MRASLTARAPALALLFVILSPGAGWSEEWRFCVGVAPSAHETVITDIFASAAESARIERRFEAYFRARKGKSLTFQCPRGAQERFAALNAQTAALQFNHKLGFAVTGLPAAEIALLTGNEAF